MDDRFDEFYATYFDRVRALVASRFPGLDVDDVAQEAMMRAYLHFDLLRAAPDPWGFLVRLTRDVAVPAEQARRRSVGDDDPPQAAI